MDCLSCIGQCALTIEFKIYVAMFWVVAVVMFVFAVRGIVRTDHSKFDQFVDYLFSTTLAIGSGVIWPLTILTVVIGFIYNYLNREDNKYFKRRDK